MSNVFNEVYGTYYNVVAKVLKEAVNHRLTPTELKNIVINMGYGESMLQLLPALKEGKWQLLHADMSTPIIDEPEMPLTLLQKRWLKTILLDKRIKLFLDEADLQDALNALSEIEPLYEEEQFLFYDRYVDGDEYSNKMYIRNFRCLKDAIKEKRFVTVSYRNNKHNMTVWEKLIPCNLEYSAKDDKFRLLAIEGKRYIYLNLGKMIFVEADDVYDEGLILKAKKEKQKTVVLELVDERKTLERALIHFSDLAKETVRLDDNHYMLKIYYDKCDETELLLRILSFGPTLKVQKPDEFIALVKNKIREQLDFVPKNTTEIEV